MQMLLLELKVGLRLYFSHAIIRMFVIQADFVCYRKKRLMLVRVILLSITFFGDCIRLHNVKTFCAC